MQITAGRVRSLFGHAVKHLGMLKRKCGLLWSTPRTDTLEFFIATTTIVVSLPYVIPTPAAHASAIGQAMDTVATISLCATTAFVSGLMGVWTILETYWDEREGPVAHEGRNIPIWMFKLRLLSLLLGIFFWLSTGSIVTLEHWKWGWPALFLCAGGIQMLLCRRAGRHSVSYLFMVKDFQPNNEQVAREMKMLKLSSR